MSILMNQGEQGIHNNGHPQKDITTDSLEMEVQTQSQELSWSDSHEQTKLEQQKSQGKMGLQESDKCP